MKVEVFIGDICDFNGVCMVMKDIDVVFYLVVLIVIFFSYYLFDVYIDINVKGIFNVIQVVKDLRIKRVLVMFIFEVYGMVQYIFIDEKYL